MNMIRTIIYVFALFLTFLFFFLIILIFLFSNEIDNWLAVSSPVDSDILIVEGWTSSKSLRAASQEFMEGNYETLITTGGPVDEVFNHSQNGVVRFDISAAGVNWSKNDTVKIALYAFGEPALGEFARYTIIHGNDTIGRAYTKARMFRYVHNYAVKGITAGKIDVVFDNDFITDSEDRNLHILKLEIDDVTIPVRSEYTHLIRRSGDQIVIRPLHHKSYAEEKAYDLVLSGIDSSIIIPLVIPEVKRFRTFADAVVVSEWLKNNGQMFTAVNIFTEGNHARRSLILYRYALPDSVKVGIISEKRPDHFDKLRFDMSYGKLNTLRQLSTYIYSRYFFNYRWHYRRVLNKIRDK